jgi:hypothetical protein
VAPHCGLDRARSPTGDTGREAPPLRPERGWEPNRKPWSDRGRQTGVAFSTVEERPQTDGFTYETDENGELLWFVPPSAYYYRRKRIDEARVNAGGKTRPSGAAERVARSGRLRPDSP